MTSSGHAEHFVAIAPVVQAPFFSTNHSEHSSSRTGERQGSSILIVSDDAAMGRFLRREFEQQLLTVEVCSSADDALPMLSLRRFDLVVLDLNAEDSKGNACLSDIRCSESGDIPLMMLTARTGADDAIVALDNGADDCLIKPFSLQEMQARVRRLLRRRPALVQAAPRAGLLLRADQNVVVRDGRRIQLTSREFSILEYLMQQYGKAVSRADLLRNVWQISDDPRTNLVDVYMKYLRDKLDGECELKLIRTVRGVGYVLSAE